MTSYRLNMGHLERASLSHILSRACFQGHSGLFRIKKKSWPSPYKLFYRHRTPIVTVIITLVLSTFTTAFPEHKHSVRNFQTTTQFAYYQVVLFCFVHILKITSLTDCRPVIRGFNLCTGIIHLKQGDGG